MATPAEVTAEAQRRAAQSGKTAQEELWNYAIAGGMDAAGIDAFMGWPAGTSQTWAVGAGKIPAPQATPAEVIAEAQRRASLPGGKTAQEELWNFATAGGMDAAGIDKYMGWDTGTSQKWAVGAGKIPAPQATPAEVIAEAQRRAAQPGGKTAQEELWNYAIAGGMDAAGIDKYMGWDTGTSQKWAVANGKLPAPQGNSGALTTTTATPTPPTPPGPLTTVTQPEYKMPVLNALYQGQQQRMFSPAPTFNFQQPAGAPQPPQPGSAAGAPQGALTAAISAP